MIGRRAANGGGDAMRITYLTRRGPLAKRRALAEAWARYCAGGAEVVDLAEVRSA